LGTTTDSGFRLDVSGSTRLNGNTQVSGSLYVSGSSSFTGSLNLSGSLTVTTTGIEFQVTNTGVKIGNMSTDTHPMTGSLNLSGSFTQTGYTILSTVSQSLNYTNDAAAAFGGVPLGGLYRSGSFILIRLV
jgi:hypothetical protein